MKNKKILCIVFGFLSVLLAVVESKPAPNRDGTLSMMGCLDFLCDSDSGPVCGIDAAGFPRTFENRCLAQLAYCREGRYYVEIKAGEC